jgi:hypothetical protein
MQAHRQWVCTAGAVLITAFTLVHATRSLSAAAKGKITGTVKLDGTPAHMRPFSS